MRVTFNESLLNAAKRLEDEARQIRYKSDPVLWAEDVLGIVMWSKQKEILRSLAANKRTAVKSCHSIGKTFTSAVAACWWVSTHGNAEVLSTAPTYQQVHGQLWEEIRKAHTKANLTGRVNMNDQWLVPYSESGRTKEFLAGEGKKPADTNIHGFQGTHRPGGVLALLDEACGLATTIFTGARTVTTAPFDRQFAAGNPDDPNTEFGEIFRKDNGQWHLITVSAFDTPNFTGEDEELRAWAKAKDKAHGPWEPGKESYAERVETMLAGLPHPEEVNEQLEEWGGDSPRALSKVFAEFPKTSMDSLFTATEIEKGRNEQIPEEELKLANRTFGVDVARYGADKTVIALNCGGKIEIVGAYSTMDTMEVAATVHKLALDMKIDQVRVDGIGPGGGVVDRLINLTRSVGKPYVVVEMTASARPPDATLHRNARAYWYDSLKHQLRNARIDLPTVGENADQLFRELGSIKYGYPNGILQIESKEDIRRRGDKSPDYVDAVVMATAPLNYIETDPLAGMRKGQEVNVNVLETIEEVSPY
jgi:hypothetical protein